MKRFFKIVIGIFLAIFLLLLLIPVFFKDKIRDIIVSEFDKATEATLYFDVDKFGLSLIKNFPDFTVSLGDFGVIGKGVFDGDTLANVKNLDATINIKEVLTGNAIKIKGVSLDSPDITIIVLEDGTANYDIMKSSEAVEEELVIESESGGSLSFGISSFSISNGAFIYFDQSSKVFTQLNGINISGKGDFAEDIFDLVTDGKVDAATFAYDGTEYVTNKSVTLDLVMSMDLPNMKFTFKENEFLINEFPLAANGSFTMFDDAYGMDLSISSPSSEFKKIFSLIPGAYTESFDDIKAAGNVSFSAMAKGKYSDNEMPAFNLNLIIEDGSVQYPGLPETINNIQVVLNVDNPTGVIENTLVDLKKMHINFGKNPFDARLKVDNLKDFPIDADIKGTLNLKDLNSMLPIEGLLLDGIMTLNASAVGKYDSIKSIIPVLDITMNLKNGVVQSTEFPVTLEKINVLAEVSNPTGKINDTKINVSNMDFMLDGQPFQAKLLVQNLENIQWDATVNGTIDLEKILKIYPMEGLNVAGIISADLSSKGKMSDIQNEQYQNLDTKGELKINNLVYADEAMGKTFKVTTANTSFDKNSINLSELKGSAGETNFNVTGKIDNYLDFFLTDGKLKGNLNASADVLNINDWMTDSDYESEEEVVDENGEPMQVIRIPENIEFNVNASVNSVIYNKLELKEINSGLVIKEGKVNLENTNLKALNGTLGLQGSYDSKPEKPLFALGFKVKEISIPQSFQSIDMIQKLAPIAEKMQGLLSTDFSLAGALGSDMMPDYNTLTGSGIIELLQASLDQDSKIISGLTSLTKLDKLSNSTLDKVKMSAEIKNGRLFVKPFDVKLGDFKTTIAGSTGIDGSIDFALGMDVQAGQIGTQLNSLVSKVTGSNAATSNTVRLNIGMTGTYAKPEFGIKGVGGNSTSDLKSAASASVNAIVDEKKQEMQSKVNQAKDSANLVLDAKKTELKSKADSLLKSQTDSLALKLAGKLGVKKDTTDQKLEEAKKKAESVLKGLLKKKKGGGGN